MYEQELTEAIQGNYLVEFNYNGLYRLVEPHILGELNGVKAVLAFQIDGESNSGFTPDWRRFNLDKITDLNVLPSHFVVRRQSSWGEVYAASKTH